MPEAYKPIDISNDPELLKLAEEVHSSHTPRILRRNDEELTLLVPVKPSASARRRQRKIWKLSAFTRARAMPSVRLLSYELPDR